MKNFWLGLIILISAYFVRYIFAFHSGLPFISTDTYNYIEMAKGIIQFNPLSFFPNGYPIIISFFFALFSESLAIEFLRHLNVLLSSFIVLIVFFLSQKLNKKIAIISTIIIMFWPNQLNYSRQLLSEVPSTFFMILGIYLLTKKSLYSNFFGGATIAFASIIRSTILPVGIFFIIFAWVNQLKKLGDVSFTKSQSFLLTLGFILVIIIELIFIIFGFLSYSSNLDANLSLSVNDISTQYSVGYQISGSLNAKQYYLQFMLSEPIDFIRLRINSFWELWGPWPQVDGATRSLFSKLIIGLRFPLFLIAIVGYVICMKDQTIGTERKKIIYLISIPIILISLLHILFFSTPRFSFSMEPFVIIFASITLYRFIGLIFKNRINNK